MSASLVGVWVDRPKHSRPQGPPQAQKTSPNTSKLTSLAFVYAQIGFIQRGISLSVYNDSIYQLNQTDRDVQKER